MEEKNNIKQADATETDKTIERTPTDDTKCDDRPSSHPKDIFDYSFKRIMALQSPVIINFINSIFEVNHSLNSKITYNLTENVDDNLKKTIADTIITINDTDSYHIEAQMYKDDKSIMLRMFEYGYNHSKRSPEDVYNSSGVRCGIKLTFPKQVVIYLDSGGKIPNEYSITLRVNGNKEYTFKIPTIKFQKESLESIIEKHMIILLPFKLLKVRNRFKTAYEKCANESVDMINKNKRLKKVARELRDIYYHDIIDTIRKSFDTGIIDYADMNTLIEITKELLDYLYSKYSKVKEVDDMFVNGVLELESDKVFAEYREIKQHALAMERACEKKDVLIAEKEEQIAEKDDLIAEKDAEIARLKAELAERS